MKKFYVFMVALLLISGARAQSCLPEGITFTNQTQIDSFQINYPGCTEIEGDVIIGQQYAETDVYHLDSLNVLTSIWGSLTIINNPLTSLSGLENLDRIGGSLTIGSVYFFSYCQGNNNLFNLTGLNGLDSIGGNLNISCNQGLTSLLGLESLTFIGGNLNLGRTGNYPGIGGGLPSLVNLSGLSNLIDVQSVNIWMNFALNSLTGLEGLTLIKGDLTIKDDTALIDLTGLEGITLILGSLEIQGTGIADLSALNNLCSVNGDMNLVRNNFLINLSGLESLESIGGSLGVFENNQLLSLSGLENLDSIGGWLSVGNIGGVGDPPPPGGNDVLQNLSPLESLTYLGGGISIGRNNSLSSLAGLDNINAGTVTDLIIGDNQSLSSCEVKSVCNYLAAPNGTITIEYNAPGCNSPEEVEAACGVGLDESIVRSRQSAVNIYPNPSSSLITIETPNTPEKNTFMTIYNLSGQHLIERQITEPKTVVDVSGLSQGVYFVKVKDDRTVQVGNIIRQ
jgi:hypothetical protein